VQCFVARQPIFDRRLNVFAYELLFRSGFANFCDLKEAERDTASSDVLTTSFFLTGLQDLTGGRKASINFTGKLLIEEIPTLFPSNMLLVEVLEDTRPEAEVLSACKKLRQDGYTVLFDDFSAEYFGSALLDVVNIVKVDFCKCSPAETREIPRRLANRGLKFLAEKVETIDQFRQAVESDYTYFQGFFFSKPVVRSKRTIAGSKLVYLRIMNEVNRPGVDFSDIEDILKHDLSLSYKLLRFINSAYIGLMQPITSIRNALALLGMREIRKWIALTTLSRLAEDKPEELIVQSLIRARLCECVANELGWRNWGPELFLVGMFSLIDAIMDRPMPEILGELPLTEETKSALLGAQNHLRNVLDAVVAYERARWDAFSDRVTSIDLDEDAMPALYQASTRWVKRVLNPRAGRSREPVASP
jgi:c-di-GMP-related signal transduction protein